MLPVYGEFRDLRRVQGWATDFVNRSIRPRRVVGRRHR